MSMGNRGIEVHDGLVKMPAQGTWASPLPNSEVDAILLGKVGITTAVTGTFTGAYIGVQTATAGAQFLTAISARATVEDVTLTGDTKGVHVQVEAIGTAITTGRIIEGVRIELYAPVTATVGTAMGIFISNYMQVTPADYRFIRCSENGGALLQSCMYFSLGQGSDATYFMSLAGTTTSWSGEGNKIGVAHGWIKVQVSGTERYIQLYY